MPEVVESSIQTRPLHEVEIQTTPPRQSRDRPLKQFTFTEPPLTDVRKSHIISHEDSQFLKREESKTTLAMHHPKPTSPPTPVVDRIALLRAQNVQNAA